MYLLDTDHMSLLATSIITYEEQVRGWTARSSQAQTAEEQVFVYERLKRQLQSYCRTAVVDYDQRAAAEFERLRKLKVRIGTMDLKIAAIALANGATLLSRNTGDFGKVPGLIVEDWSV